MEITEYGIERFGPSQARKYLHSLYRSLELISDQPAMGRAVPELGASLHRFEHGRHSIFYTVQSDHVLIGRVIDNRRDMRRHFRSPEGED